MTPCGASALINAARNARVLSPMSEKDAVKLGVSSPKAYFAIQHDATKANMTPSLSGANWFHFVSVNLGNGDPFPPDGGPTIDGDSVGAIETWTPPTVTASSDPAIVVKAQAEIAKGSYRKHQQSPDWSDIPSPGFWAWTWESRRRALPGRSNSSQRNRRTWPNTGHARSSRRP